jgi:hypothetical protein
MEINSDQKNVLFVNSAVMSLRDYINPDTLAIEYNAQTSTRDEMMPCFSNKNRIGFAFHYYELEDPSLILFLNQEPFFTDSDLRESAEIYSPNVQFMLDQLLSGAITHVDFLACNTLQHEKWKRYYQLLQSKTGVVIGASDNNTGNLLYGGDWIMESTMENIRDIYFTTAIFDYTYLLLVGDFSQGSILYKDLGANKLWAYSFTKASSLTHLNIPDYVTKDSITYSVTELWMPDNAGSGFTAANENFSSINDIVSVSFPSTLTKCYDFTFRNSWIREFDLTNTRITSLPPQFAHASDGYILKLPYTCTSLVGECFNNLKARTPQTPLQLRLPGSITSINSTPFHHSGNPPALRLGELIMYDAVGNNYKYVGTIQTDILFGGSHGTTLNNIIINFTTNKNNPALWALTISTSVFFPSSTTSTYKVNTVTVTADPSNAVSVRYSLNGGSTWITNTTSPVTSIALPDGTYAIGAIKVIATSSTGSDSSTFSNISSAITIYLAGPIGLVVSYPSSTMRINNKVQSVTLTTFPSGAVSWSYSVNSGSTWTVRDLTSSSFVISEALYEVNSIQVKCANDFGNFSAINYNTSSIIFDFGYNTYFHTFYSLNATNPTVLTRTMYNNAGTVVLDTQDISFGGTNVTDAFRLLDGDGTNPYTIGIVDSSQNKICMDIAYCGVYTKPLTTRQQGLLITNVNERYKEPHTAVANTYTVTVTNNVYWISSMNRPDLLLNFDKIYIFDNISNLPFYTNIGRSTNYVTGVVTNSSTGTLNNYTLIDISNSAPASLFYGSSETIGGNIYVSANTVLIRTSSSFVDVGGTFTVTFLSSLPAGTSISYSIGGTVTSENLNNITLLNNTFTSPNASSTYSVTGGGGSTVIFSSAFATSVTVNIKRTIASMSGILFDVKYGLVPGSSPPTYSMVNFTSNPNTYVHVNTGASYNTTDIVGFSGILGAERLGAFRVSNKLTSTTLGVTIFMVVVFKNTINNRYFFHQCPTNTGGDANGFNMYITSTTGSAPFGLSQAITNLNPGELSNVSFNGTTKYIITLQYGTQANNTYLFMKSSINGVSKLNYSSINQSLPNSIPNFFRFGEEGLYVYESIAFSGILSDVDISFVEQTLASTYNIY